MEHLIRKADVHTFFAKEMELIKIGQPISESLSSFQFWLCSYLSLIEESSSRNAFLARVESDLDEIHLVHKYRNIYGQDEFCNDSCSQLTQKLKDYLRVKYGEYAA
jgi:hypothetical protein